MPVTKRLREALLARMAAGVTVYRIAKDAGLAQPVVARFASGERQNIRGDTIDKLAAHLGLVLDSLPERPQGVVVHAKKAPPAARLRKTTPRIPKKG